MVEEPGILEGMILYKVAPHVKILQHQPFSYSNPACGIIKRVRVLNLSKCSTRKRHFLMFWGKVLELTYDPARWIWEDDRSLLDFSTAEGRKMLAQSRIQLNKNVAKGWPMVIPSSFKMKCADVWLEATLKKEA